LGGHACTKLVAAIFKVIKNGPSDWNMAFIVAVLVGTADGDANQWDSKFARFMDFRSLCSWSCFNERVGVYVE
jgi:hypothetical protein